jgi:hypothetical protein
MRKSEDADCCAGPRGSLTKDLDLSGLLSHSGRRVISLAEHATFCPWLIPAGPGATPAIQPRLAVATGPGSPTSPPGSPPLFQCCARVARGDPLPWAGGPRAITLFSHTRPARERGGGHSGAGIPADTPFIYLKSHVQRQNFRRKSIFFFKFVI